MGTTSNAGLTATRSRLDLRRRLATTPSRLRLAAALLTLSAIVFGAVAAQAVSTRRQAVQSAATTERRLVQAVDISAHLSDAHATAAYSFLVGGPEPARTRLDYVTARDDAAADAAAIAADLGTSARGRAEVRRITRKLPEYTGLLDSARANFRLGYPLGSAYLRQASNTMRDEMLPAARRLYAIQAQNLTTSFGAGVSGRTVLVVVLAALLLLGVLAAAQIYMARTTRRIVNLPLAVASALMLALTAWILIAFALQQSALVSAQAKGSDPVELLTATRILALRAQALESIRLAARGGGASEAKLSQVDRAFTQVTAPIKGLLAQADAVRSTAKIDAAYATYLAAHGRVVEKEKEGRYSEAVQIAASAPGSTRVTAEDLTLALDDGYQVAQASFRTDVARAASKLDGLEAGVPLLTVLCALLALSGVRQRLEEYR